MKVAAAFLFICSAFVKKIYLAYALARKKRFIIIIIQKRTELRRRFQHACSAHRIRQAQNFIS
jgi:hypothetical protein